MLTIRDSAAPANNSENIPAIPDNTPTPVTRDPLKLAAYLGLFSLGTIGLASEYALIMACIDKNYCAKPAADVASKELMLGLMFSSQLTLDILASSYKTISSIHMMERYFPRQKNKFAALGQLTALTTLSGLSYMSAVIGSYGLTYLSNNPSFGVLVTLYLLNDLQNSIYGTTKFLELDLPYMQYQFAKIVRNVSNPQFERMLRNVNNTWKSIVSNEARDLNPAELSVDQYLFRNRPQILPVQRDEMLQKLSFLFGLGSASVLAIPRIYVISSLFGYANVPPMTSVLLGTAMNAMPINANRHIMGSGYYKMLDFLASVIKSEPINSLLYQLNPTLSRMMCLGLFCVAMNTFAEMNIATNRLFQGDQALITVLMLTTLLRNFYLLLKGANALSSVNSINEKAAFLYKVEARVDELKTMTPKEYAEKVAANDEFEDNINGMVVASPQRNNDSEGLRFSMMGYRFQLLCCLRTTTYHSVRGAGRDFGLLAEAPPQANQIRINVNTANTDVGQPEDVNADDLVSECNYRPR